MRIRNNHIGQLIICELLISPKVGLEAQLDGFVVEGALITDEAGVLCAVEHEKSSMWGWQMYVSAGTPEVRTKVEEIVTGFFAGRKALRGRKEYINPLGNPSTSEVVNTAVSYQKKLRDLRIAKVRFTNVSAEVYKKAVETSLKLQQVK